jgi:large subunit ribosomal protein L5
MMTRLLEVYKTKVLPELKRDLQIKNDYSMPRIEKIVVNAGIGKLLASQPKNLDLFLKIIEQITGQHPVTTRAKKAIAGFKIRENQVVGLSVTLRGKRMYDFLDKLISIALPRSRDFRGLSRKGFDGRGNYSLGIKEHIVFPEMIAEETDAAMGLQITIATSSGEDELAYQLLKKLGFPFKD